MTRILATLALLTLVPMTAFSQLLIKDGTSGELDGWSSARVQVICTVDLDGGGRSDIIVAGIEDIVIADPQDLVVLLDEAGATLFVGQGDAYYSTLRGSGAADHYRLAYLAQSSSEWATSNSTLYNILGEQYWDATGGLSDAQQDPQGGTRTISGQIVGFSWNTGTNEYWLVIRTSTGALIEIYVPGNVPMPPFGGSHTVNYTPQANGTNRANWVVRHP